MNLAIRAAATFLAVSGFAASSGVAAETVNLAGKVREILQANCYRCHGQDGTAEGGMNYLMDRDRLVAGGQVVPGKPAESALYQRVTSEDAPMPPSHDDEGRAVLRRPGKAEIAVLKEWIKAGAPEFGAAAERPFISTDQTIEAVRADLAAMDELDRRFARYLTLTHLHNGGLSSDELQTSRNALARLVNSLSWAKEATAPRPIGPAETVLRIDLRDYKWSRGLWETIVSGYPYGIEYETYAASYCSTATGSVLPWIRGDWFLAAAARPPLYHEVLRLPDSGEALEEFLHVDREENIAGARVARAGFNGSGVSRNNRLIERHESIFGAYWISYDFAGNVGPQNLFESPLGPGDGKHEFRHDGGEIIFNLPNGLQAYMIVDGRGSRIDRAPTEIVSDPRRPDRAVENGLSCMSCHAGGIIEKGDQIRDHVENNRGSFPRDVVETILRIHPPKDSFRTLQRRDAERFRKAVETCGSPVGTTEPISALVRRFESELDLKAAAAEAGLRPDEFLARLDETPRLGRTLGVLKVPGGTVQRQAFARAFEDMIVEWKLGRFVEPARSLPVRRFAAPVGGLGRTAPSEGVPDVPVPRFTRSKVETRLPEPFAQVRAGGGGRYLVFHLKQAGKLAVYDVAELRIVHQIDLPADDVLYACGRDKLLLVLPGQRVIQRWDLATFRREATAAIGDGPVRKCVMGHASRGPLALWGGGKVRLWDIEQLQPLEVDGPVLAGGTRWGFELRVSADGRAFVGWVSGLSPQQYGLMRLEGNTARILKSPDGFSFNGHWCQPSFDASLLFHFGGGIYTGEMERVAAESLKDAVLLPADDPRFFLALRSQGKDKDQISICTSADRSVVHTFGGLEKTTNSSLSSRWGFFDGEPRVRWLPAANVVLTLPDRQRIVARPLNLIEALEESGTDYLFATSLPERRTAAGSTYVYRIEAESKQPGLRYKLESGPEGMTVSDSGELRWNVPSLSDGTEARVVVSIRNRAGKEIFHAFDLNVE